MPPKEKFFTIGQAVLCLHQDVPYEARIVDIKDANTSDPLYIVHYQGWNSRYDEEVRHSKSSEKIYEATDEKKTDAKLQREKLSNKKKKNRLNYVTADESDNGSRGNSPSVGAKGKGTKRKTGDSSVAENLPMEINITLPKALRSILVDDVDLINKQYLVKLPARVTIDEIVSDYATASGITEEQLNSVDELYFEYDNQATSSISSTMLGCSSKGIVDYFNVLLAFKCLYKFEKPQYQELVDKEKSEKPKKARRSAAASTSDASDEEFRPSKYYGIVHLLRLLVQMPDIIKMINWNDHLLKAINQGIHDFLVFLNKNHEKYYSGTQDYEPASLEYYRASHQS